MTNGSKVIVCHKSLVDAPDDYAWQTDTELAHLTATLPLTTDFSDYLIQYASQLRNHRPIKHQFAVKTRDGKHIGNCSYYNINKIKGEAEIGIIIGDRHYWDKGYGTDAVGSLVSHIFEQTNLSRIHLRTLESNKRAQRCFSKCGFSICGHVIIDGYSYFLMELRHSHWQQNQR